MARARQIKPGFFKNEDLSELSAFARLMFIGMWCLADRRGILEDRPRKIRMELLPMDDVDAEEIVQQLADKKFITRYVVNGIKCIQINNFDKHQAPHPKEQPSDLPAIESNGNTAAKQEQASVLSRQNNGKPLVSNEVATVLQGSSQAFPSSPSFPSLNTPLPPEGDVVADSAKEPERPQPQDAEDFPDELPADDVPAAEEVAKNAVSTGRRHKSTSQLPAGFLRFWDSYPAGPRKVARTQCVTAWARGQCEDDTDLIVAAVERLKKSESWVKENGQFIPMALTFIHQRRWEGVVTAATTETVGIPTGPATKWGKIGQLKVKLANAPNDPAAQAWRDEIQRLQEA